MQPCSSAHSVGVLLTPGGLARNIPQLLQFLRHRRVLMGCLLHTPQRTEQHYSWGSPHSDFEAIWQEGFSKVLHICMAREYFRCTSIHGLDDFRVIRLIQYMHLVLKKIRFLAR